MDEGIDEWKKTAMTKIWWSILEVDRRTYLNDETETYDEGLLEHTVPNRYKVIK